jgi:hypothetical protein
MTESNSGGVYLHLTRAGTSPAPKGEILNKRNEKFNSFHQNTNAQNVLDFDIRIWLEFRN